MSVSSATPHDGVQETIEEGPARYAVFANRLRTAFTAGIRYSAYSSELGEAFRPLTKPAVVRSLYAVSWSYVIGDVAYAGYKARELHRQLTEESALDPSARAKRLAHAAELKVQRLTQTLKREKPEQPSHHYREAVSDPLQHSESMHVGLVVARRAVFQSLASMALPAFTVHSIVHYSQPLFASVKNHRIKAIGPTILGLAIIPALPVIFDEPVEHIIDTIFDFGEAQFFSDKRVSQSVKEDKARLEKQLERLGLVSKEVKSEAESKAHELKGKTMDKFEEFKKKSTTSTAFLPLGALVGAGVIGEGLRRQRWSAATAGRFPGLSGIPRGSTWMRTPKPLLFAGGLAILAASISGGAATSSEKTDSA